MSAVATRTDDRCPREALTAYLDGELSAEDERLVESHLSGCRPCLEEFNLQKRLLSAIAPAFAESRDIPEVPVDFARVVTVKAESSLERIRTSGERFSAAFICSLLLLFAALGLAFGGGSDALIGVEKLGVQVIAVGGVVVHSVFELGTGVGVILKGFGGVVFSSFGSVFFSVTFFVVAFLTLSRLLMKDIRS